MSQTVSGPYVTRIEAGHGAWFARPPVPGALSPAGAPASTPKSADAASARSAEALNRGDALHRVNRLEEALASYDQAIGLDPHNANAFYSRGVTLQRLQRFEDALSSYARALALKPDHADALYNGAIALARLKRFEAALASYDRLIALSPGYVKAFNNRGGVLQALRRFEAAVDSYDRAIALKPDYVDAISNRGIALQELKRFEEAVASYDRAIAVDASHPEVFNARGIALQRLDRFAEALASFDRAIALRAAYPEALNNRAVALRLLGRLDEALAGSAAAISLKPDYANAFYNQGLALGQLRRFDAALVSFDRAIALRPDWAEALNNRGNVLQELMRFEEALASYDAAIAAEPDYAEAFNNRGIALQGRKRSDESLASFERAIALKPDYAEAFNNRAHVLKDEGKWREAITSFERAIALKPDFADAKLGLCMAQLPVLYRDEAEIGERREAYAESLAALCAEVDELAARRDFASAIGSIQPYYLAYQGQNDRDLQARYGALVCRVMAERYPPAALPSTPRAGEQVRLGIVSGFFWRHSNWKIPIRGWLEQIDRRRFKVFGYHTGTTEDGDTATAAALCDRFVRGPLPVESWRNAILEDAPHVLIYPEVGMNAVATQLAAQRLARVQCNSWGHPDTSGFPTLDYYLSSELMEPPEAQEHYTERLVRLPNLSIYYEPLEIQPGALDRAELGLKETATVFWCGQALFKYLPQFDQVFARIAHQAGDCQFAFIRYEQGTYVNDMFLDRLDLAFAALGLKASDYCVLLPRLDGRRFMSTIANCDIVLDSIGWSGCNTTLEVLTQGLPVVTMAGSLMRGRHTVAILKMMGIEETVGGSLDDYIAIAVRLARDADWRRAMKSKMLERKHRLYRDAACIAALEDFLEQAARNKG